MERVLCVSFQLFQFNGRFHLLPSAGAPCAEFLSSSSRREAGMSQGQELASPFGKKCHMALARLALAEVSQCCAVLCRRKLSTDAYHLLCFWHVEQGQCGAAVPKEACFILCLLKCGSLHSLLAPSQSHPCTGHQVLFSKCCTLFFLLTQPSSPRPASESA